MKPIFLLMLLFSTTNVNSHNYTSTFKVNDKCFKVLKKPVIRYTAEDTPVPVAPNLEKNYVPTVDRIVDYAKKIIT